MKIKDLVSYWDKHAKGRLTRDACFMALSDQHHRQLETLSALYPLKSSQDLIRDLISAALDEVETEFPYVQGDQVVAYDEDGFEIYEDKGLTPEFVRLSQKHIKRLKARQLESVA
ncbi:pilin assembly protein [Marinobacter salexigens]|uniref:Pilin assembly protein n=1 Tax=Marinobacter salexigens TaxID=1925763 RepID=A0ABS6ADK3_9GAMM|nr:pilin assembly protein [Marinobacter salexigens]MBU2875829.1 pilin assembly protein [Marinobacter salexigens]